MEHMSHSITNRTLQRLEILLGTWEIQVPRFPGVRGRATFEWLEEGAFLVHRSEVDHDAAPNATMIIGGDESTETYCVLYSDSRGVSRVYHMSLSTGVWKMWGTAPGFSQRFTGTLSDDGAAIRGYWESSADSVTWEHDFDLTYTKIP